MLNWQRILHKIKLVPQWQFNDVSSDAPSAPISNIPRNLMRGNDGSLTALTHLLLAAMDAFVDLKSEFVEQMRSEKFDDPAHLKTCRRDDV